MINTIKQFWYTWRYRALESLIVKLAEKRLKLKDEQLRLKEKAEKYAKLAKV